MWSRIGVKAKLRTLPLVNYFPMIQRNEASIYMLGWGVPTFDALYGLQSGATVGTGGDGNYNVGRYSNQRSAWTTWLTASRWGNRCASAFPHADRGAAVVQRYGVAHSIA